MAYAVAILLISALTTVGLLALWAATSTAHWFWRTMGFLAAISPVLLIPAYEPFVAFVIQGAVVTAGVQFAKWRTARKQGESFFKSQFSVRTVLLAMAPLGLLTAVAVRLPVLNQYAWQSFVLIGLGAGATTLAAWWVTYGQSSNWIVRFLLALLVVSVCSIVLAWGDYFIYAIDASAGWPPDPPNFAVTNFFGSYDQDAAIFIWTPILLSVLTMVGVGSKIMVASRVGIPSGRLQKTRYAIGGILLVASAIPAAVAFAVLMSPLPIPSAEVPNPNGYDEFKAATNILPTNLMVNSGNFDSETATELELQQASDEIAPALDRVRQGLNHPAIIDLEYHEDDLEIDTIQSFRTMARGFAAQGRLLLKKNQPSEAADVFINGASFGVQIAKGGLMVDDLVGSACSGGCYKGLFITAAQIPAIRIPKLIATLQKLETGRDPWKDVVYRDRVWSQRAHGWYGHSLDVLSDYFDNGWNTSEAYEVTRQQELAVIRLLQLELALRLWQDEHDGWPKSVDELSPNYIEKIPVDPFSTKGEPMKSVFKNDQLIIYSVGRNQDDEAGMKNYDESGFRNPFTGDLRLDILYASEPSTPIGQNTSAGEDEEAEADSP
jgi:hypothetical protein